MSERELLNRLMSQTLLENIKSIPFSVATSPDTLVNVTTAQNRQLFDKIGQFVLAKEPMQELLQTVVPAGSIEQLQMALKDTHGDWSYAFLRNYRQLIIPVNGQFDQYTTTGEAVYAQERIEEDFLERYAEDMVTQVEFAILTAMYEAWHHSPIVTKALCRYVASQYVLPLKKALPGVQVHFRFVTPSVNDHIADKRTYVLFVVNIDNLEHPEQANCIARTNEGYYHISVQKGKVPC